MNWALGSRIAAAVAGGYALAVLASMAAFALPWPRSQAVLAGTQITFLIYAVAVICVFAARSASRAWAGLAIAAAPLAVAAWAAWR